MKKILSCLSLLLILFLVTSCVKEPDTFENRLSFQLSEEECLTTSGWSPISGTFIQPWLYLNYTDEELKQELLFLHDMGINKLIIGDLAIYDESLSKWEVYYETDMSNTIYKYDVIKRLFMMCEEIGIKIYLGIGLDSRWWSYDLSKTQDISLFNYDIEFSCKIVKDLYDKVYKEYPNTFGGYYFVYEIYNHISWNDQEKRNIFSDVLSEGFNKIITTIKENNHDLPLIFSPFCSENASCASIENSKLFYMELFSKTSFRDIDVICPMDNIGGGSLTVKTVEKWYEMYTSAIKDSKSKICFSANCENFVQPDNKFLNIEGSSKTYFGSAPVKRYIEQIKIASKYAKEIFSFSYPHYYSEQNNNPMYNYLFKEYFLNNLVDDENPSIDNIEYQIKDKQITIKVSATDNYGLSRIALYSNDVLIDFNVTNIRVISDNVDIANTLIDESYYTGKKYTIYVTDIYGNVEKKELIIK